MYIWVEGVYCQARLEDERSCILVIITVRLRHRRTKGSGTRKATLTMVYKLCQEAANGWRKLDGFKLIPLVEEGVKFVNGERVVENVA